MNTTTAREKYSYFCIAFAIYISLVLVQTPYKNIGTLVGAGSLVLVFGSILFTPKSKRKGISFKEATVLILFFLYSVLSSVLIGGQLYSSRLVLQLLLFLVISGIHLSQKENELIGTIFGFAMAVFAVLIIISCIQYESMRYVHGDIYLFNTFVDPNYLCIPLVCAAALLLDGILKNKRMILNIILFAIVGFAIVMTSSRGGLMGLILASAVIIISFFRGKNMTKGKKIIIIAFVIVLCILALGYISRYYSSEWDRMLDFTDDNGRSDLWKQAIDQWKQAPVFGVGIGTYTLQTSMAVHNTYLEILTASGVIGFILFCTFLWMIIKRAWRIPDKKYLAILLGTLVQIIFLSALDNRMFWGLLCWVMIADNSISRGENKTDEVS